MIQNTVSQRPVDHTLQKPDAHLATSNQVGHIYHQSQSTGTDGLLSVHMHGRSVSNSKFVSQLDPLHLPISADAGLGRRLLPNNPTDYHCFLQLLVVTSDPS